MKSAELLQALGELAAAGLIEPDPEVPDRVCLTNKGRARLEELDDDEDMDDGDEDEDLDERDEDLDDDEDD